MIPSVEAYDPFAPEVIANPFPWYEVLRTEGPCRLVVARDMYVISCFADVVMAARNTAAFEPTEPPTLDPAARRAAQPQFVGRALAPMRPRIDELANACVDTMIDKGTFDLVAELAEPFPKAVLAELMPDLDAPLVEAGTTTVAHLIGNAALTLMADPLQWRRLQADRGLIPSLIEETLRYESPVQAGLRRTLAPVEVRGNEVPAGSTVLLLFGSANRDPSHYPEPDRFDVARNPVDHLGFGSGGHACLGAGLARMEATAVAEAVLGRVRAIRPAGEAVRTADPFTHGVASLPCEVSVG